MKDQAKFSTLALLSNYVYSKTYLKWPLKIDKTKVLMVNGTLMKVVGIAECILHYF